MQASHDLDRLSVTADHASLIADAGLILPATLGRRLGLGDLLEARVTAGPNAADKCLTVIHSALAGGDCIDDVGALRAGATQAVLGHRVTAPSTVGTFLRSMSWGHARQLDAVSRQLLVRAATAGAVDLAPGSGPVVVDIDATLVETYGLAKSGTREVMRTGRRGYHPLLAVLAGTGDVVHARLRRGRSNDATGAGSFVAETIGRLREAMAAAGAAADARCAARRFRVLPRGRARRLPPAPGRVQHRRPNDRADAGADRRARRVRIDPRALLRARRCGRRTRLAGLRS